MPTSLQKLDALAHQLQTMPGEGEEAMLLELGRLALPSVRGMLPSDPAELDERLQQASDFILSLKSDPPALAA